MDAKVVEYVILKVNNQNAYVNKVLNGINKLNHVYLIVNVVILDKLVLDQMNVHV